MADNLGERDRINFTCTMEPMPTIVFRELAASAAQMLEPTTYQSRGYEDFVCLVLFDRIQSPVVGAAAGTG